MKNLIDSLTENTLDKLELYALEHPMSAKELAKALRRHKFFCDMRWGDVENLCYVCKVSSPYDLLIKDI